MVNRKLSEARRQEMQKRLQERRNPVKRLMEDLEDELLTSSETSEPVVITDIEPQELEDLGVSELVLFVTGIEDDKVEDFLNEFEQLLSKYSSVVTDITLPPGVTETPPVEETPSEEPKVETEYELVAATGEGGEEVLPIESEEELIQTEALKILVKRILENRRSNKFKKRIQENRRNRKLVLRKR
jgi:hypothetical protein